MVAETKERTRVDSDDDGSPGPLGDLLGDTRRLRDAVEEVVGDAAEAARAVVLGKAVTVRRFGSTLVFAAALGAVGVATVIVGAALFLVGLAGFASAALGGAYWSGALLVGGLVLAAAATIARTAWLRSIRSRVAWLRERLEQRPDAGTEESGV